MLFNSTNIPLKWLLLFIFFSIIYLIFASVMYLNTLPTQLKTDQMNINKLFLTWKW